MNTLDGTKRGGLVYTATLILFLTVALRGQFILNASGADRRMFCAVSALFPSVVFFAAYCFCSQKFGKPQYVKKPIGAVWFFLAVLLAVGMFAGLGFLNIAISDAVKSVGGKIAETVPLESVWDYVLFSVVLCVLPAIAEELFFRGLILGNLSRAGKVAATLTVSLCFALYHGNVYQLAYQFIYGAALCVLTLKSKSVLPAVLAHFLNNFAVISVEFFGIPIELSSFYCIAAGVVAIVAFIVFIALLSRSDKKSSEKSETETQTEKDRESVKNFYFPFGIIGIAAMLLLIVVSTVAG